MGRFLKVVSALYIALALVAVFALAQIAVNYALALEANAKFYIELEDVRIADRNTSPTLILSLKAVNPSKLDVEVNYMDYTIYLANKSRAVLGLPVQQAVAIFSSYNRLEIKQDSERSLTFIQNISHMKDDINRILDADPDTRIDYNIRLIYKLVKFPQWEEKQLRLLTYQETSTYG